MLRPTSTNDFFIILIVVSLVFVAIAKLLFEKRFNHFASILINSSYLKVYSKDQKFIDLFDGLLFLNLLFSASIFGFICYNTLFESTEMSVALIFKFMFGIGVFILIKVLLERLIGSLFSIDNLMDKYLFQKTSYKNYLGLALIPINVLLLFSMTPNKAIVLTVIILLTVINIIGLLTSYKSNLNLIKRDFFYFILYLCALEIGPYIILYKVFIETKV
ncbi:MAG: DUF4271 domain-containing protein [Xanthomarina sp.]|uniref:DUF4271 domain-containing protein n=1 Tax=Xanthomarina sp. TaxID=1931211 RepID=UPI000C4FD240|nr:DUF4271 domain-containing protein [Xanthomarina sp.]MAL22188.1 DUF4271 domain-containing protein [Xanthomarina sp.]MBF61675.1 DUF4271 domain-containing protein [Xanthomarina sp.]HAI17337.1 DUF4271 domain-containing protein [Xanthomarina gelatinilytica]|tara:strand:- start:1157 stop:1810 length:654 start_codon:yes stop_codon:yes gene_type:complete